MPTRKTFGSGIPHKEQTIFNVNFRKAENILETIQNLCNGSKQQQSQLIMLALGILGKVDASNFELIDRLELLQITENVGRRDFEDFDDINSKLVKFTEVFMSRCKPTNDNLNARLCQSFAVFFKQLNPSQQVPLFGDFGFLLNQELYQQSTSFPSVKDLDLQSLIKWSSKEVYQNTDERLRVFIEEASKTVGNNSKKEETEITRKHSMYNVVENLLKARNRKCVSPPGLSLLVLSYIFGGRSRLVCEMLSSTGAKGTYKLVKEQVLKNSEETSFRKCQDGVEVFYSFDNVQKLFAIHRLYAQNQNKAIARVATSIVKCYPDGLLRSEIQYLLDNNPMKWLHSFTFNINNFLVLEFLLLMTVYVQDF
jgi:hypothetical protein